MLLLKTYQHLGYFARSVDVPESIITHIANAMGEQAAIDKLQDVFC